MEINIDTTKPSGMRGPDRTHVAKGTIRFAEQPVDPSDSAYLGPVFTRERDGAEINIAENLAEALKILSEGGRCKDAAANVKGGVRALRALIKDLS
jgi:hypothetical protein